jgi:hypothetical protein
VGDVKPDVKETGWKSVDWVDLARDRNQWWTVIYRMVNLRVA